MSLQIALDIFCQSTLRALEYFLLNNPEKYDEQQVRGTCTFIKCVMDLHNIFSIKCRQQGPIYSLEGNRMKKFDEICIYFKSQVIEGQVVTKETAFAISVTFTSFKLFIKRRVEENDLPVLTGYVNQDRAEGLHAAERRCAGCAYKECSS